MFWIRVGLKRPLHCTVLGLKQDWSNFSHSALVSIMSIVIHLRAFFTPWENFWAFLLGLLLKVNLRFYISPKPSLKIGATKRHLLELYYFHFFYPLSHWVQILSGFTKFFSNTCWKFQLSILKKKRVLFLK